MEYRGPYAPPRSDSSDSEEPESVVAPVSKKVPRKASALIESGVERRGSEALKNIDL